MASQPEVTVIIPNYNGKKLLENCIQTLERQTCTDFKLLVVDNGSDDGSTEVTSSLQGRIVFFFSVFLYLHKSTGNKISPLFLSNFNQPLDGILRNPVICINKKCILSLRYINTCLACTRYPAIFLIYITNTFISLAVLHTNICSMVG